jgi:hypothetical protein
MQQEKSTKRDGVDLMSNKHSTQLNLHSFFSDANNFQAVQDEFQKIALITACSKKKLLRTAPAKKLYQGSMFKKAGCIAEKIHADFFILSAKYGLIGENTIIRPYDTVIRYKKDIKEFFYYISKFITLSNMMTKRKDKLIIQI